MSEIKNKTIQGLAWGGFFSILQQLTGMVFSVAIARILFPADYGMVGMLTIFTSLATVMQESGFIFVLANRDEVSNTEYSTVFWVNVFFSLIIYIVLYFSSPLIGHFYDNEKIIPLARFVFLGFVISSLGIVQNAYLYRLMHVKEKGIATIVGMVGSGIIGLYLAFSGYHYWAIATQGLVSTLLNVLVLWYLSPFRPSFFIDMAFIKKTLPDGLKFAIPNLVGVIGGEIYSLILGKYYTVKDVGLYNQGKKFYTYGYMTIIGILRNISQPMMVELRDDNEAVLRAFRKLVRFTVFVSLFSLSLLAFVAPELILVLLTEKWLFSATILRILCVSGFFASVSTLFSFYIVSQNETSKYMWLGITSSICKVVCLYISSFWGVVYLAYANVFVDFSFFVIYYFSSKDKLRYCFLSLMNDVYPVIFALLLSLSIGYLITINIQDVISILITKLFVTITIFAFIMELLKYDIYVEIKDIILSKIKLLRKS